MAIRPNRFTMRPVQSPDGLSMILSTEDPFDRTHANEFVIAALKHSRSAASCYLLGEDDKPVHLGSAFTPGMASLIDGRAVSIALDHVGVMAIRSAERIEQLERLSGIALFRDGEEYVYLLKGIDRLEGAVTFDGILTQVRSISSAMRHLSSVFVVKIPPSPGTEWLIEPKRGLGNLCDLPHSMVIELRRDAKPARRTA